MRVVLNRCFGCFQLSDEATQWLGSYLEPYEIINIPYAEEMRCNPHVINCVESLGAAAESDYSHFEIIEIPDNIDWYIEDNDGFEEVHEMHRFWPGRN